MEGSIISPCWLPKDHRVLVVFPLTNSVLVVPGDPKEDPRLRIAKRRLLQGQEEYGLRRPLVEN